MSDYPMLISNKLHSFRNFSPQIYKKSKVIAWFPSFFYDKIMNTHRAL